MKSSTKNQKKTEKPLPHPLHSFFIPSSSSNLCSNSPPLQSLPSYALLYRNSPPLQSIPFSKYHLIIHLISAQEHNEHSLAKAPPVPYLLDSTPPYPLQNPSQAFICYPLLSKSFLCTRAASSASSLGIFGRNPCQAHQPLL